MTTDQTVPTRRRAATRARLLGAAREVIAEKGAAAVDFRVESKDGKVSLKARPVK